MTFQHGVIFLSRFFLLQWYRGTKYIKEKGQERQKHSFWNRQALLIGSSGLLLVVQGTKATLKKIGKKAKIQHRCIMRVLWVVFLLHLSIHTFVFSTREMRTARKRKHENQKTRGLGAVVLYLSWKIKWRKSEKIQKHILKATFEKTIRIEEENILYANGFWFL